MFFQTDLIKKAKFCHQRSCFFQGRNGWIGPILETSSATIQVKPAAETCFLLKLNVLLK